MFTTIVLSVAASAVEPQLLRQLASRDPIPCEQIESASTQPVVDLLWVVDNVDNPPWSPMRAADCLIKGHSASVAPQIDHWVVSPDLQGLGRLVLANIDSLPQTDALRVGRLAVQQGPLPEVARNRLASSDDAQVRAIANEVGQ